MFGTSASPVKDEATFDEPRSPTDTANRPPGITIPESNNESATRGRLDSPTSARSDDASPSGEKRNRRSSGIARAKEVFSGAKNSFFSPSPTREKVIQTPIQKLGKTDPALSVPQGSLNNAAGESAPGPRSTFRVGVTEDKNKKCRRTMEDTHAYLYNFLSTPAPVIDPKKGSSLHETSSNSSVSSGQPVVETDNGYFAIFDGHAGTFAAEWCGKKLHLLLEENIRKNPNKAIPELLDETFTTVDQQLEKLPLKNSGCTAVIAVLRWEDRIPNSQSATGSTSIAPATAAAVSKEVSDTSALPPQIQSTVAPASGDAPAPAQVEAKIREASSRQRVLYTANVGDARIVLCRNGKALRLSYDHKGSDDNEGKRIANAGGLILNNRVNGVLAVTRALGDAYMKDLVTGHPYTTETVIQPDIDEFLILACDGLWDVCSDQEAVDLVRNTHDPLAASKVLVDHALARFSTDNLSCMIVRFNSQAVSDTVAHNLEPIGVEGDAASSVQGGVSEAEAIVGAAKRNLEGTGELSDSSGGSSSGGGSGAGLGRLTTQMVEEEVEEEQETGPELDPEGLKKAREKAREGQTAVGMASEVAEASSSAGSASSSASIPMSVGTDSSTGPSSASSS